MKLLLVALLFFTSAYCFSQIEKYQKLLDTGAGGHAALFVHIKPLKINSLASNEMWYYVENIKELSNQNLDTVMFSQIICNSKSADTTHWTDKELTNSLLVYDRTEMVSKKYALEKLGLTDKKLITFYKSQVNKYNSTDAADRNLCYFSRPVFDNSKSFAVVQWDNGHSNLGGGGNIILYQLQNDNTWKEFGIIKNWKY